MIKKYKFIIGMLGLAAALSGHAEDKPPVKVEPAPVNLPVPAKRYLDFYSSSQLSFAIDPDSISIPPGPDAEVRYTMKATSQQGAVNISYEGIRCDNRQKIIYAVGRSDGSWSLTRSPEWTPIFAYSGERDRRFW